MRARFAPLLLLLMVTPAGCRRDTKVLSATPPHAAVTIARAGSAAAAAGGVPGARVIVLTSGVAIKETGPAETVRKFGEVYAFVPQTIIVRRDEPTLIEFWNLQPDDTHDFMLTDPKNNVMLKTDLSPLSKTIFVMTFHDEGRFPFYCVVHQPAMSGQILVVAPGAARAVN
jgi:plastocyanin